MATIDDENEGRPITPTEEDCCGNACNPCIFDVHKKLLEEWKGRKQNKLRLPPDKNFLSLTKYNKFIIDTITKASEDCIFIYLNCVSEDNKDVLFLLPGQHIMIKFATTTKPYTPIFWTQKNMKLLIKLYSDGEASNCIKQLKVNDELLVRGPYGGFNYSRNSYKNIIMFSIGSGIAAMYPIANSIVNDELEDTKIDMFAGFRFFSYVPLINELRLLTDYWNFECTLYLSRDSAASATGIKIVNCRLEEKIIKDILNSYSAESSLILICGTLEFNEIVEKIVVEERFSYYHVFR